MPKKLVNLTPHPIVLHLADGRIVEIPPMREPVRLQEFVSKVEKETIEGIGEIEIREKEFGEGNLPEPEPNTLFIVSLVVAQAYPNRRDFVVVDETIRDEKGRIIGCRAFARVPLPK